MPSPPAGIALKPHVPQPVVTKKPSTGLALMIGLKSTEMSQMPAHCRRMRSCERNGRSLVILYVYERSAANDDWRADRVWLSDVNLDGFGDLLLVTNDTAALPENRSHLRILVNEPRSGLSTEDRVFRDRTVDLMAPIRTSSQLYGGGGQTIVDNWRGLDMWVGDIDKGSLASPPADSNHAS